MDIGVVGAGIVGLATAYELTQRGATVTVYDRGQPGHGQSGGDSRIFRHVHADERLVRIACEAREGWRAWEQQLGEELLVGDGAVSWGPAVDERLALLERVGGVRVSVVTAEDALPLLVGGEAAGARAILDRDAGVLRTRASIAALCGALLSKPVCDEVLAVRTTDAGCAEVRTGNHLRVHDRVVVCAGRGTKELAASAGLELPIAEGAHVRLSFEVHGEPPDGLACMLDGDSGAYGDPLPGNTAYAIGIEDAAPGELAGEAERTCAYVERTLPGVDPSPVGVRHCWVTTLPWGHDGIGAWEHGTLLFLAGNNLFKHAPVLGSALAGAALGEGLREDLRAEAQLGCYAGGE